ncbi:hypothetical protein FKM82_010559 [Ascaphus truei]
MFRQIYYIGLINIYCRLFFAGCPPKFGFGFISPLSSFFDLVWRLETVLGLLCVCLITGASSVEEARESYSEKDTPCVPDSLSVVSISVVSLSYCLLDCCFSCAFFRIDLVGLFCLCFWAA